MAPAGGQRMLEQSITTASKALPTPYSELPGPKSHFVYSKTLHLGENAAPRVDRLLSIDLLSHGSE